MSLKHESFSGPLHRCLDVRDTMSLPAIPSGDLPERESLFGFEQVSTLP